MVWRKRRSLEQEFNLAAKIPMHHVQGPASAAGPGFLLVQTLEGTADGLRDWVPGTHLGCKVQSWLLASAALDLADIWGVTQMDESLLSISLLLKFIP